MDHLRRYAPIIDDVRAFEESLSKPLPRTVWANPLKRPIAEIARDVLLLCPRAKPLNWTEGAWRLPYDSRPGRWLPHLLGELYVQEEAAMLAGSMVSAQPGERVLDLCAAPGGKSMQLAVQMKDRGHLFLNEKKFGRISSLRWNLGRMGVTCATVNHNDGLRLDEDVVSFDRVLVDAPCTCEGTSRKTPHHKKQADSHDRDVLIQIQVGLLRKALRLVKPGGSVLYSTCTYAPEENEGVLNRIKPHWASIEPLTVPDGIRGTPGLTSWHKTTFRPDVSNAVRIWPHHNDTGGFFIAKLRRL